MAYRKFKRASGIWYAEHVVTLKQFSLLTRDEAEANTKLAAHCEVARNPLLNREMARVYLAGADPLLATRTWQDVMDTYASQGKPSTKDRKEREFASKVYDRIRDMVVNETRADDFLAVLKNGGAAVNSYLARLHNFARGMNWLVATVIAQKLWPKQKSKPRKAVTEAQHVLIMESEKNPERHAYYELLWHTGGSQTDIANLTDEDIDFVKNKLVYHRGKKDEDSETCYMSIGPKLRELLWSLPRKGPLFPKISKEDWKDRAAEFARRCRVCKIRDISLHSYRYMWAQRAEAVGYPERFAMVALGHESGPIHRHYAHGGDKHIPSLEDFTAAAEIKVVPFPDQTANAGITEETAEAHRLLAANPALAKAILSMGAALNPSRGRAVR